MGIPSEPIRVLHVDDEPGFSDVAAELLEREAEWLDVTAATSATEGLDRLAAGDVDCVVSDYDMPERNGVEFLRAVREDYPDLPFILFTGKGSEEVASEAISAGVTDYLQKETGTDQYAVLANRIRNVVERYRSRKALESTRERLSLFIDQSPLGVIEWTTDFEVARANEAAEEILGWTESELVGRSWTDIVPESERQEVGDVVDRLLKAEGGYHSVNRNVTADGGTVTCEWHNRVVTDDDGDVVAIFSQFQDVTDRVERETAIEALHEVTGALVRAETPEDVAELTVEAGRDVLDMSANVVHLYDEEEGCLRPVASTEAGRAVVDEVPTFAPGEGLAWKTFETGEPSVFEDVSTHPDRHNPETPIRSEIIVPIGEHGVLTAGSTEVGAFDETDVSLARILAANAQAALARAEREAELRESWEFTNAALDALDEIFYVFDRNGRPIRWNDRLVEVTGYTDEQIAEMDPTEFFVPDHRDQVADAIGTVYETGDARIEADVYTADGERIPYEVTGARLTDSTGDQLGFVGIGRDITERRERERELERYERILEASGDPVYTLDADGHLQFVNDALVGMTGYDESELVGSHVSMVMDPEEIERARSFIRSLLSASTDRGTVEVEMRTADDERIPCEAHLSLRFDDDGAFRGTIGVVRDVSERTRRETALERIQERTEALVRTATVEETAQVAVDTAREVLDAPLSGLHVRSEDGTALDPVATTESVAEQLDELPTYRRDGDSAAAAIVWDAFERGEQVAIDDVREREDLAARTDARSAIIQPVGEHGVFVLSSTEPNAFDEIDRTLVELLAPSLTAALDRAERETLLRERERELARQNERLEEFASVVSHDLRNPLNVARGRLELAREELDGDDGHEHLADVAGAHDRMAALIEDLLALAREGETATDVEPVDLAALVDDCWGEVGAEGASLVVEDGPTVLADRSRLRRLVENLLVNAVTHGGEGVTVTIGALDGGSGFHVSDDGPGIPEAERDRVFEPGYSTASDGTGFGLRIVERIAEAHGWTARVTESADGGARFEIAGVDAPSRDA